MRIAIVGVGGVGGFFGGRLAQAGEDVFFVARGAHLQALQTQGLRVDGPPCAWGRPPGSPPRPTPLSWPVCCHRSCARAASCSSRAEPTFFRPG